MNNTIFFLERVSQPDIEPVTLAEAKRHLKQFVNVTTEDADVEALIRVGREWVENYTGRAMIDQTWRLTLRQGTIVAGDAVGGYSGEFHPWRDNRILLRRSPVLGITSFVTVDDQGVETVVDPATYTLWEPNSKWPSVGPLTGASWQGGALKIEFRAGFVDRLGSPIQDDVGLVPATLIHAVKLVIANFDVNREPVNVGNIVNKMPYGLEWLLQPEKCDLGMA